MGAYLALVGLVGWTASAAVDRLAKESLAAESAAPAPVALTETRSEVLAGRNFGGMQTIQQWPNRSSPPPVPPRPVQSLGIFGGFFAEPPPPPPQTFATVCVRLCDGFYWPVSFSTTEGSFGKDDRACQASCNMPTRLFIYRNPGSSPDDMTDLRGQPYSRLPTAFQYRASYSESCKCRAHPWEQEAKDRHRMYALQQSIRKGDTRHLAELQALEKQFLKVNATAVARAQPREVEPRQQPLPGQMSLGGPKPSTKSVTSSPGWRESIFSR